MRALFLVNPQATATTQRVQDVLVRAFSNDLHLDVAHTEYRGHARSLAAEAAKEGYGLILPLGGDGTVNEVVNGALSAPGSGRPPAVGPLPGGSANVFARALGLPADPVEAAGAILEELRAGHRRTIGLGRIEDGHESRYFTFCAGFGWDASAVREVERQRWQGQRVTPGRYIAAAARMFLRESELRRPSLSLSLPGEPTVSELYLTLVTNTTPWTYAGNAALQPTPRARFERGLDVFAMDRLDPVTTFTLLGRMLSKEGVPPEGQGYLQRHDEAEFTVHSREPRAFQLDGDYLGDREKVNFYSVPEALQVIG